MKTTPELFQRFCLSMGLPKPGDLVYSPFAGIGSEGYGALSLGRKFVGSELKKSYADQACVNLKNLKNQGTLL